MKKKNGMTMVEILLSVALISLVIVFVFNILIDLRQEETFSKYKSSDQLNRSIITKTIQDDLIAKGGLVDVLSCNRSGLISCVELHFADHNVGFIKVAKDYISYETNDSGLEKWSLEAGEYSNNFSYCYNESTNHEKYLMRLYYPVSLKGKPLENRMNFDIEILYIGSKPEGLNISNRAIALGATGKCN